MGSFRATGTFSGLDWFAIGGGELCGGRGVDGGDEAGGTVIEGVLVGTGRAGSDETGVDSTFWLAATTAGCGFATADTVTRVPTLPVGGPVGSAAAVDGLVVVVLDRVRNVFEAGIVGIIRAP